MAVLVDGAVPAGALGLDERLGIPVIGLPAAVARAAREALAQGVPVHVSLASRPGRTNDRRGRVAPFSSHGLAFGGGVKPELVAPGVELVTADVGRTDGRLPRYATISGSSAAAALVGGAAALVAQSRPELDADALKGVLVGTAVPLRDTPVAAQGAGFVDPGAASAAEVAARAGHDRLRRRARAGLELAAPACGSERHEPAPARHGRRRGRGDRRRLRRREAATAPAPPARSARSC